MGHCKDCRYWTVRPYLPTADRPYPGDGRCDAEQTTGRTRLEIIAYANDDTDLGAAMITGPDFGCVLFKASV